MRWALVDHDRRPVGGANPGRDRKVYLIEPDELWCKPGEQNQVVRDRDTADLHTGADDGLAQGHIR